MTRAGMIRVMVRDISEIMAGKPVAGRVGQDNILLGRISRSISEYRSFRRRGTPDFRF
jgi:hypothetical protein